MSGMPTPRGEALLAVIGVTAALRPGPVRINQRVLQRAEGFERTIRRRLRRFVRTRDLAQPVKPEPFDFDEIAGLLPHAENEARHVENVAGFANQAAADEFADALGSAVGYLRGVVPSESLPTLVGSHRLRPSDVDVWDFRRRYRAVDTPLIVLDNLLAGMITPDEVEALGEAYPALYAAARAMVLEELIGAGDKPLSAVKDAALRIFLGTETLDPTLQLELSKAFEAEREKQSGHAGDGSPSKQPEGIGSRATQQEKLEAR